MKKNKRLDAEKILGTLAEIRSSIPHLKPSPRRPEKTSRVAARTMEEFETAAVVDALETLSTDLHAAIEEARTKAYESALDVYYTAEELSHDPAHAEEVRPHLEAMAAAHLSSYGKPVPPKEETERRRAAAAKKTGDA
ncbi:MAG TPA: hypothetical protein VF432_25865 [Thermoanaerobaculia bacterium]